LTDVFSDEPSSERYGQRHVVVGRKTFEVSERWGGTGPFGAPTFVVTLIPVLLGEGKRLFEHLGGRVDLGRTQVVEAPEGVTHLRFRVVR
jgi:dihydrofolate reductase